MTSGKRKRLLGQVQGWIIVIVGVTMVLLGLLSIYHPSLEWGEILLLAMYLIGIVLIYSGAVIVCRFRKKKGV